MRTKVKTVNIAIHLYVQIHISLFFIEELSLGKKKFMNVLVKSFLPVITEKCTIRKG